MMSPDAGGIPVPLASLAQPDDTEKMNTPAEGDSVSMQVDATILSIQGDVAIIQPVAINGKPLGEEAGENPNAADEQEGAELQGLAQQMS
jgi:hypothetical protein